MAVSARANGRSAYARAAGVPGYDGGMLQPRSLGDLACDEIRSLIATGVLKPGQRVRESQLLERLEISRTPLREALRILETQHVLILTPNRGYTVAPLSQDDIDEIYSVRAVLEEFAMRLVVPRLAECDFTAIEETTERMRKAAEHGDHQGVFRTILDFHIALVELAANRRLSQTYMLLMQQMQLYVYWDVSEGAKSRASLLADHDRHRLILDSLKSGNEKEIALALAVHGERRHLESVPETAS